MARTYHRSTMEDISLFSTPTALEGLELFNPLSLDGESEFLHDYDVYTTCIEETKPLLTNLLPEDLLQDFDFEDGSGLLDSDWMTERLEFNSIEPVLDVQPDSFMDLGDLTTLGQTQASEPSKTSEPVDNTVLDNESPATALGNMFADVDEILKRLCADRKIPFTDGGTNGPSSPLQNVPEVEVHSPCGVPSPSSDVSDENMPLPCSDAEGISSPSSPSILVTPVKKSTPLILYAVKTLPKAAYFAPYPKEKPVKIKSPQQKKRKRDQNKDAATRYRVKKREEQDDVEKELTVLEKDNVELKDQVTSLSKEIEYLKNLMLEVYKTKLQKQAMISLKAN